MDDNSTVRGIMKGSVKTFEWFCFSLEYKSFVKFSKKIVLSRSFRIEFLNYKDILQALGGVSSSLGKLCPTPKNSTIVFGPGAGN